MEKLIPYECLKCGAAWDRPEVKDPLVQCPKCHSDDYDRPRRGENLKACSVCLQEYSGSASAHGNAGPCSRRCRGVMTDRSRKKTGVFI